MRKWGWLNVGGFPSEPPRNGPWVGFDHPKNLFFFFFFFKKKKKRKEAFLGISWKDFLLKTHMRFLSKTTNSNNGLAILKFFRTWLKHIANSFNLKARLKNI
jgi:hypothetical protein